MDNIKRFCLFFLCVGFLSIVASDCINLESCEGCVISEKCMFLVLKNKEEVCILKRDFFKYRPRFSYSDVKGCGRKMKMQERAQKNLQSQRDVNSEYSKFGLETKVRQNETISFSQLEIARVVIPTTAVTTTTSTTTTTTPPIQTTASTTTTTTTERPRRPYFSREKPNAGNISSSSRNSSKSSVDSGNFRVLNANVPEVESPILPQPKDTSTNSPRTLQTMTLQKTGKSLSRERGEILGSPLPFGSTKAITTPVWMGSTLSLNNTPQRAPLTSNMTLMTLPANSTPIPIRNDLFNISKSNSHVEGSNAIMVDNKFTEISTTFPPVRTVYQYVTERGNSEGPFTRVADAGNCSPYADDSGISPFECKGYFETNLMRFERSSCRSIGFGRIVIHERPNIEIMEWIQASQMFLQPRRCILLEWKRKNCLKQNV